MEKTLEEMLNDLTHQGFYLTFTPQSSGRRVELHENNAVLTGYSTEPIFQAVKNLHHLHFTPPPPTAEELLERADKLLDKFNNNHHRGYHCDSIHWQKDFKRWQESEARK